MAGTFSGHLLHSYHTGQAMNLVTSGAMSFNSLIHGTPIPSAPMLGSQIPFTATPYANETMSEETAQRIATLQVKLDQKLGPEYISQRQGPRGGPKLTYAEGWKMINLANEVFGFNGWSSSLVNVTTDFVDRSESGRYNVGVTAIVRVTLREGVYHEDIGYGTADNSPSKGQALDKCKKEAVTDGLKRALRNFGNLMGNCLYDKAYTQEVVKMKVPPAKFDKTELHRRPEFSEDRKPSIINAANTLKTHDPQLNSNSSMSSSKTTAVPTSRQSVDTPNSIPSGHPAVNNARPLATSHSNSGISAPSAHLTSLDEKLRSAPSHQPQNQPQLAQSRRHVSFAEEESLTTTSVGNISIREAVTKSESEDDFDFGDDESFLAALGMEQGDLGRPIETDADMGRPIDHEETNSPLEDDASIPVSDVQMTMTEGIGSDMSISRNDNKNARVQRLQEIVKATNTLKTSPPIKQTTPLEQIQNAALSPTLRTSSTLLRPLNQANQPNMTHAQQRNHQPLARPANHSRNEIEDPITNSGESGTKRPRMMTTTATTTTAPSMKGFHFPPGMDTHQQGGSGIGTKRSVDLMSSSSNFGGGGLGMNVGITGTSSVGNGGFRGSRPGMGLQQAAPQQRREPFMPIEIGESGDTKRIRR